MFDKISTALLALFSSNAKIQSKYDYEASKIEGFPAMTITPSANENDYATTTENRRTYAFMIRLYEKRGSTPALESTCEKAMRDMVDTVLDTIDKTRTLSGVSQTGYTFLWMSAAPSQWGYAGRDEQMRVAEIRVALHFDIDTTLIT